MITHENGPLVSCLCLTRERADKLPRSIACFLSQTYANRELVVLCHEDDDATRAVLAAHAADPRIRSHDLPVGSRLSFGEARKLSAELARGDLFCIWDDDCWHHPDRIATQARTLERYHKPVTLLTNPLIVDAAAGAAYLPQKRLWEGSLMCRRGPHVRRYEDVNLVERSQLVKSLIQDGIVYPLAAPNLYVYELHDRSDSGPRLRETMLESAQKLSPGTSAVLCEILSPGHSPAEAAKFMDSSQLLEELNYFHGWKLNLGSEELARFKEFMKS